MLFFHCYGFLLFGIFVFPLLEEPILFFRGGGGGGGLFVCFLHLFIVNMNVHHYQAGYYAKCRAIFVCL